MKGASSLRRKPRKPRRKLWIAWWKARWSAPLGDPQEFGDGRGQRARPAGASCRTAPALLHQRFETGIPLCQQRELAQVPAGAGEFLAQAETTTGGDGPARPQLNGGGPHPVPVVGSPTARIEGVRIIIVRYSESVNALRR